MPTPFFNYFCGLQRGYLRRFLIYIKRKKIFPYRKRLFSIGWPLIVLYIIPYLISSSIVYLISKNMNISIIFGMVLPIVLCCLYFPIYVKGCHMIVVELKPIGIEFLKEEIKKDTDYINNNLTLSEEEKEILKQKYKQLQEMLDKDSNNEKKEDK
jgi:hypothetical protein